MPELFYGGFHGGASGPDIVEEEIGGLLVDCDFGIEAIGGSGLLDTSGAVGADLDGVLITEKKALGLVIISAEFGEVLSDEVSVVETASANVFSDGGEGNNDDIVFEFW